MVLPSAKNYATIGGRVHVRDLCCRAWIRVLPPLPLGEGWGEGTELHGHACTLTLTLSRGERESALHDTASTGGNYAHPADCHEPSQATQ
jgi:hypothetical protein